MARDAKRLLAARDQLLEGLRWSSGRTVTAAEAMTLLGSKGRRVVAEAERVAGAERKAMKRAAKKVAEESILRARVNARITEALTAAQAPAPPPGTGQAPEADAGALFGGTGLESPFWQPTGTTAVSVPEPAKELCDMSPDELRAHAAGTLGAFGRAAGFRSPVWQ
jgi:hypothetical protein